MIYEYKCFMLVNYFSCVAYDIMKSITLIPYCPLPINSGAKMGFFTHLDALKRMGLCTIVSARSKPVGNGWSEEYMNVFKEDGCSICLREEMQGISLGMLAGIGYASVCKGLRLERAFGHSNPYHRWAFPKKWWRSLTEKCDLAVIHYTYWAHLPCNCPKVVVVHDLWSDRMWEGSRRETEELRSADLVVVVSKDDEEVLKKRGITNIHWTPPAIPCRDFNLTDRIGVIGSHSIQNLEGLRWLEGARSFDNIKINVYGSLSQDVEDSRFRVMGYYEDNFKPYQDCGIFLIITLNESGVQLKTVEALACGRAIVARKGSMRGLPKSDRAWIEVETADDMLSVAKDLQHDVKAKENLASEARKFYKEYLDYDMVIGKLVSAYSELGEGEVCWM